MTNHKPYSSTNFQTFGHDAKCNSKKVDYSRSPKNYANSLIQQCHGLINQQNNNHPNAVGGMLVVTDVTDGVLGTGQGTEIMWTHV